MSEKMDSAGRVSIAVKTKRNLTQGRIQPLLQTLGRPRKHKHQDLR